MLRNTLIAAKKSNKNVDEQNFDELDNLWQEKLELYKKYLARGKYFYEKPKLSLALESLENILCDAENLLKKEPQLLADAYTYKGMILRCKGVERRMEAEKLFKKALEICPNHELAK